MSFSLPYNKEQCVCVNCITETKGCEQVSIELYNTKTLQLSATFIVLEQQVFKSPVLSGWYASYGGQISTATEVQDTTKNKS